MREWEGGLDKNFDFLHEKYKLWNLLILERINYKIIRKINIANKI